MKSKPKKPKVKKTKPIYNELEVLDEPKVIKKTEKDFQLELVKYLRATYVPHGIVFCASRGEVKIGKHVKDRNGRFMGERIGSENKSMGYWKGFPDITIYAPRGNFGALMLELKSKTGYESKEQKETKNLLKAAGYCVQTVDDMETTKKIIKSYLALK
jgi:hypothetical protein